MRNNSRARVGGIRMTPIRYFDAHLHLRNADEKGLDDLLRMIEADSACVGGNIVLNTTSELDIVLNNASKIPPWLQLIPSLDLVNDLPRELSCGWVKIHPQIQRIDRTKIPGVVAAVKRLGPRPKGVMVHCFPWGGDFAFNCSLELVAVLAQSISDCWILATHGGGYESWAFRAHVGGLRNVLFDFSASLSYYAGSDLLRPLQRYLTHSPDRVLFGSDWPSATQADQWLEMLQWARPAGLTDEQLASVLFLNSQKIWPDWDPRQ